MPNNYFPYNPGESKTLENPAFQLFGNRLFKDQTVSELLVEFLIVVNSQKRIGDQAEFETALPNQLILKGWDNKKLEYAPKARLNLKLFSFLGASRLESRHSTHRNHYKELVELLKQKIINSSNSDKDEIVRTIEDLFVGFQGAGSGRTWCAQSFLPISESFLAGESIWKETKAKALTNEEWSELFTGNSTFFDMSQHAFLARGGELIYLQLCNALRVAPEVIRNWCNTKELGFSNDEQNPAWLHQELENALNYFLGQSPDSLNKLATFIDSHLDSDTPARTDGSDDDQRFVSAGWCNDESWQEGYIFAVELLRLLSSNLDIIERISLLETACAMQVLRSLTMQSMRVNNSNSNVWPGFWMAVSAPQENRSIIKRLSSHSVKGIEKLVFQALRNENHVELPQDDHIKREKILKQADKGYGGKLFIGLAKRIGFIVPKRGGGARFVLNDQLLRLLVVTTVPIGGRLSFNTFKELLEHRYGMVFDVYGFERANQWLTGNSIYLPMDTDAWFLEMLDAAGFLIHLSDSFALVYNPADSQKN